MCEKALTKDAPWLRLQRRGLATGLLDLDTVTHGLAPATLWIITGKPGTGRTMLAAQVARAAAFTGATTRFISGREDRDLIQSYWLAAEAGVPLHHLLAGYISPEEAVLLADAQERLEAMPLAVWTEADEEWVHDVGRSAPSLRHQVGTAHQRARVLVVDDVDILLDAHLPEVVRRLRDWTRTANFTLVVTVPEDQILEGGRLLPGIARDADVALRLAREDLFCGDPEREGEAHLDVLRNRYGPVGSIGLSFNGFRATFEDYHAMPTSRTADTRGERGDDERRA